MSVSCGVLALLEAKPGKGDELAAFLEQGRALAAEETGTVTWYAFKLSDTTYGVFDTFDDEEGRQAHLNGQIPAALGSVGPDLLAEDPNIQLIDIIAVKAGRRIGMGESRAETGARGVIEGLKGWTKRTFGQLSGRRGLEREGREQESKADAERTALRHETEAARAKAEAETREARQRAAEWTKESGT